MNRRDVLRLCGLSAFAVAAPGLSERQARAQERGDAVGSYDGPLFISIHAGGGWDPTSLCDPKGQPAPETLGAVNHYLVDDIRQGPGDLRWAPFADNDAFFERHGARLRVINGIDFSTNGHDSGTRHAHSGDLAEGSPALTALVAAARAAQLPLPFITNGGYDVTRGVVARTRVGSVDTLRRIASPNQRGNDAANTFNHPAAWSAIQAAQEARGQAQVSASRLPRIRESVSRFVAARTSDNVLAQMLENLPDLNGFSTDLGRQGAVALAAWRSGLTATANLSVGGFDTHGDHDRTHAEALTRLTRGIDELWREVERVGAGDQVLLMIASDFGRTPSYNDGNGKDHWPLTSMMLLGAGVQPGVIGGTDAAYRVPTPVDPQTLLPSAGGVVLTPGMIHRALRTRLGVTGTTVDRDWPIVGDAMPILG
jgi:uncharacterized protein (DUF1501 family)